MKKLISFLVEQFVTEDNFEIVTLDDGNSIEYKVLVDKEFIARVIGKGGRTSRAIRTLVKAANDKGDKNISVFIEER